METIFVKVNKMEQVDKYIVENFDALARELYAMEQDNDTMDGKFPKFKELRKMIADITKDNSYSFCQEIARNKVTKLLVSHYVKTK